MVNWFFIYVALYNVLIKNKLIFTPSKYLFLTTYAKTNKNPLFIVVNTAICIYIYSHSNTVKNTVILTQCFQ